MDFLGSRIHNEQIVHMIAESAIINVMPPCHFCESFRSAKIHNPAFESQARALVVMERTCSGGTNGELPPQDHAFMTGRYLDTAQNPENRRSRLVHLSACFIQVAMPVLRDIATLFSDPQNRKPKNVR
jgi:hypothetical protein